MKTIEEIIPLNQEIVIATSDLKGNVKAIFVIAKGFVDGKLLFGLCNKGKTFNNIKENKNICVIVKNNGYFRINGKVEIIYEGEILETLLSRCKPPMPILSVLVEINEIWDLDKNIPVQL